MKNGYSLRVDGVPQSRGTVQIVSTLSCLSGGPGPQFFWEPVMRPRGMAGGAPALRESLIQDQNQH